MSSEHVEVLERLRGVLEHGKMGDKCLIAPDLVTAAIASLSAPQPPAEAQPVYAVPTDDGNWEHHEGSPPPMCDHETLYRTPPPSAPVGVEDHVEALRQMRGDAWRNAEWCSRGNDDKAMMAHHAKAKALDAAIASLSAQQPAAVAPVGVEEILAEMHEEGQADIVDGGIVLEWVDNLRNALAQQPAPVAPTGAVPMTADDPRNPYSEPPIAQAWANGYNAVLAQQPAAVDGASKLTVDDIKWLQLIRHELFRRLDVVKSRKSVCGADRRIVALDKAIALATQQGGSDNDR